MCMHGLFLKVLHIFLCDFDGDPQSTLYAPEHNSQASVEYGQQYIDYPTTFGRLARQARARQNILVVTAAAFSKYRYSL